MTRRALIVDIESSAPYYLRYCALLDGYEPGDPIGRGATPLAAVRALAECRWEDAACDTITVGTSAAVRAELRRTRGRE